MWHEATSRADSLQLVTEIPFSWARRRVFGLLPARNGEDGPSPSPSDPLSCRQCWSSGGHQGRGRSWKHQRSGSISSQWATKYENSPKDPSYLKMVSAFVDMDDAVPYVSSSAASQKAKFSPLHTHKCIFTTLMEQTLTNSTDPPLWMKLEAIIALYCLDRRCMQWKPTGAEGILIPFSLKVTE